MNVRIAAAVACSALLASCALSGARNDDKALPAQVSRAHAHAQPHWSRVSLGRFVDPYAVAVNPHCSSNCTVYVADPGSKEVWKLTP